MPIDKNEIAKQKTREIRDIEKQIIKNQYESEKLAKTENINHLKANEKQERLKTEMEIKNMTQKQIQEKLQRVQEMNQFLMKQMDAKKFRDRLEKQWKKEGEKPFVNKYKDKMLRDKVNCDMCHKDY